MTQHLILLSTSLLTSFNDIKYIYTSNIQYKLTTFPPHSPMKSPSRKPSTSAVITAAGELIATASILLRLPPANLLNLLRRLFLFLLSLLLHFSQNLINSRLFPPPPPFSDHSPPSTSPPPCRALSHVLSIVSSTPVSSRKYNLVKSLSDRLLDLNLTSSFSVDLRAINGHALSDAFGRTIRRLERSVRAPVEGSISDLIGRAIGGGIRKIGVAAAEEGGAGGVGVEKLAAELLWIAQKMVESGVAGEAVVRWGSAAGLARAAMVADTRIQVAFVKVSVFLFRQAHGMQLECQREEHGEYGDLAVSVSQCGVLMLRTWLPLLCHTSNGAEAPILSGAEREEMVRVLEEVIEKADWEQQEEVLGLWLLHFASCPDSDWPNLESCYTRWYARSRELFLKAPTLVTKTLI